MLYAKPQTSTFKACIFLHEQIVVLNNVIAVDIIFM